MNLLHGFDAVQEWHRDVQDDDVRLMLGGLPDGFAAVARLGDDGPVRLGFEDIPEALPHERVIVRDEDAKPAHGFSGSGSSVASVVPTPAARCRCGANRRTR